MSRRNQLFTAASVLCVLCGSAVAQDRPVEDEPAAPPATSGWSEFSLATGFEYSSGDYGAAFDTDILYVPLTAKYENELFQFRVTVPYIRIEGPGAVLGGADGGVVVGPGGPGVTTESGLGDIILAATLNLYPDRDSPLPYVELTGKVKLPTADEDDGLGTGETDYTIQADIFKSFGPFTPFGTVGYRFRGDPPGFELNNSLLLSAGGVFKANDHFSFGGVYDYREASSVFSEDASEVTPFVVVKPTDQWAITGYGVFGLSDGSPDAGGGLQIRRAF